MESGLKAKNWREHRKKLKEWKDEEVARKAAKKRKAEEEAKSAEEVAAAAGRRQTLSIAVPASIVDNAQSPELKTYLIGQIARAAVIFNCDEIVVYDEHSTSNKNLDLHEKAQRTMRRTVKILQYLECPQYLRRHFFPLQEDLKYAGLLNPLDARHHFKAGDVSVFREGAIIKAPGSEKKPVSYADVGLQKPVRVDRCLTPGVRVTVKIDEKGLHQNSKRLKGVLVSPNAPRAEAGLYWGYTVRVAESFSAVFEETSFDEPYDLVIGTSERGESVDNVLEKLPTSFKHALVVFGGLHGIEASLDADEKFSTVDNPQSVFQYYINTCPNQASNTIRTEEAILVTLSSLRPKLFAHF